MEDAAYFNCGHRPYYLPFRNPYFSFHDHYYHPQRAETVISDGIKYLGKQVKYVKILAYIQIFIGGTLLITDVSRVVLLWGFVDYEGSKLEMLAQISFPVFSLTLGFVSLAASYAPSSAFLKILAVVFVSASIPTFVQPRQAVFLNSALEAIEVGRAAEKNAWKGTQEDSAGMIRSEMHNKLARILSFSVTPGKAASLGVQDLTSLPPDLLAMMQYLLTTYAIFSFLQLVVYSFMIFLIFKILADQ